MNYKNNTGLIWPATMWALAALLLAAFPLVYERFPTYAPGYLIQIPAVAVGYYYFDRFALFSAYTDWRERGLLLLSFVIPLQNTFWLKAFRKAFLSSHLSLEVLRPEIALLLVMIVSAFARPLHPERRFPFLLKASFFVGLAGYFLSAITSPAPGLSLATGFFEILMPFAIMYAFVALAPDRQFLIHSIALMTLGVALVSISLIASAFITFQGIPDAPSLPFFAADFHFLKRHLDYLTQVGGNAYENPDFYISLWVLLVPTILLAYYQTEHRILMLIVLAILLYAGLLEYSRAGLIMVALGAVVGTALRFTVSRKWSWLPTILLALSVVTHLDSRTEAYFSNGVEQFGRRLRGNHSAVLDGSGDERAASIHKGLKVALDNLWTGVGYGTYKSIDPIPPHSTLIHRFAEGGIFGALSILLLALYAPLRFALALWRREKDLLLYACLIGTGCFMLKGLIFSASFSLVGIVVWGFSFAILTVFTFAPLGENHESYDDIHSYDRPIVISPITN